MNLKANHIKIFAALIILSTSMCTRVAEKKGNDATPQYESEGNYDWKENMTIAERDRNEAGLLLPLQSYEETILRGMSFLLEDHLKWFKGSAANLIDEKGETQMPWVYYSNIQHHSAQRGTLSQFHRPLCLLPGISPLFDDLNLYQILGILGG